MRVLCTTEFFGFYFTVSDSTLSNVGTGTASDTKQANQMTSHMIEFTVRAFQAAKRPLPVITTDSHR